MIQLLQEAAGRPRSCRFPSGRQGAPSAGALIGAARAPQERPERAQGAPQPFPAPGGAWRSPATPGKRRGPQKRPGRSGRRGQLRAHGDQRAGPGAAGGRQAAQELPVSLGRKGAPCDRRADRRGQGTAGAARTGPGGPAAVSGSWGSLEITGDAREAAGDLRRQLQEIRSSGPRCRMCPIRTRGSGASIAPGCPYLPGARSWQATSDDIRPPPAPKGGIE